jgi:serine/threonine protein kinase/WD40 repeat protein
MQAEEFAERYLALHSNGCAPLQQEFLAGCPTEIRAEVAQLIAGFLTVSAACWSEKALVAGRMLGDFRLVRPMGEGAMGVVWEAEQVSLRRRVALKILLTDRDARPAQAERFQREARAAGRLDHPGIVAVHLAGEEEGLRWIAQQLVPGGRTLAAELAQRRAPPSGKDAFRDLVRLFAEIARALEYAHGMGVIHCDIKPANLLLDAQGRPKIADFGLARLEDELEHALARDLTGTPNYMAPEQADGPADGLDSRADLFSLGVTFFEALTGRRPFRGDSIPAILDAIRHQEPPDPRALNAAVPRDLAVICLALLEKDRAQRLPSAGLLARNLERWLAGLPIEARPAALPVQWLQRARRKPLTLTWLAAGALLLPGGLLLGSWIQRNALQRDAHTRAELLQNARRLLESDPGRSLQDALAAATFAADVDSDAAIFEALQISHERRRFDIGLELATAAARPGSAEIWGFSPEGEVIAWDSRSGRMLGSYTERGRRIAHAIFSSDGALVATRDPDGTVLLRAIAGGRTLQPDTAGARVLDFAFENASARLLVACADGTIRVHDLSGSTPLRSVPGCTGRWSTAIFAPGGARAAFCDSSGGIALVEVASGAVTPLVTQVTAIRFAAFAATAQLLATASADGVVTVWQLADGTAEAAPRVASGEIVAFGWCGGALLCALRDGRILSWKGGGAWRAAQAPDRAAVLGGAGRPDGSAWATAHADGSLRLWLPGADADAPLRAGPVLRGHTEPARSLSWTADGQLLTVAPDGAARLWSLTPLLADFELSGASGAVALATDYAGGVLAIAHADGSVTWWDPRARERRGRAAAPIAAPVRRLVLAGDGRRLLVLWRDEASAAGAVQVLDLEHGARVLYALAHELLPDADLHPSGQTVALAGSSGFGTSQPAQHRGGPLLVDLSQSDRPPRELPTRGQSVRFSPDGALLLVTGCDATPELWPFPLPEASAEPRRLDAGLAAPVTLAEFSRDGKFLAVATRLQPAVVAWEIRSGREVLREMNLSEPPEILAWHPQDAMLVCGTVGGAGRGWFLGGTTGHSFGEVGGRAVSAGFSPDGRWYWLGGAAGRLTLARATDALLRRSLQPFAGGPIRALAGGTPQAGWWAMASETGPVLVLPSDLTRAASGFMALNPTPAVQQ